MEIELLLQERDLLKLQLAEQLKINKELSEKLPRVISAISKGTSLIYALKTTLLNADDQFKHAINLFDGIDQSPNVPSSIYSIATLYKQGNSVSQMAQLILGDKKKKSNMHRLITKAKQDHPDLFKT